MGSVFMVEHVTLGRRAALKMLHAEYSHNTDVVTRFFNEARAATAISNPGIVQIFDFGHHTDGSAYIVMELLEGEPLDRRLARCGTLPANDALRLIRQAASTLGAAHARGIVHRDLKPENLFVTLDSEIPGGERVKILDFGIAKLTNDRLGPRTQTSAVMGTPTYMSPEQCRGAGHVDQRSDVYSLGCVLFTLIVGRPPFDAEGAGEIIAMHLREAPPIPSQLKDGISREVDQIIATCLAKDPMARFPDAATLAQAIGGLLGGSSPRVTTEPAHSNSAVAIATSPTTLSAATGSIAPSSTRSSRMLIGAAVLVVVGAAVGVMHVARKPSEATETIALPALPAIPHVDAAPTMDAPSPPDLHGEVARQLQTIADAFVRWASSHPGAPCPTTAALGLELLDPWRHPFQITCTDQPGDQIVGIVSSGEDGTLGTTDDISSWQVGAHGINGSRWKTSAATALKHRMPPKPQVASPPPVSVPTPTTDIPGER